MTTDPKALIERLENLLYPLFRKERFEAAQALRDLTAENARLKALGDGLAEATKRRQECERGGETCHVCAADTDAALAAWETKA